MGVKINFMGKRKLHIGVNSFKKKYTQFFFFLNDKNPRIWDIQFLLTYPPPLSNFA